MCHMPVFRNDFLDVSKEYSSYILCVLIVLSKLSLIVCKPSKIIFIYLATLLPISSQMDVSAYWGILKKVEYVNTYVR